MYFELYPGLWISDYSSLPTLYVYNIDCIINLTNHKFKKAIPFTKETLSAVLYKNTTKNTVFLISKTDHIKYIVKYLIDYAKVDERTAWQYIQSKYLL